MDFADDILPPEDLATEEENRQAKAAALRRQQPMPQEQAGQAVPSVGGPMNLQQLALLGELSGDPTLSGVGKSALQMVHQQQIASMLGQKAQALADYRGNVLAGKGLAAIDPETVIHIRPDFTDAVGGEDVVRDMHPQALAAALKAYDAKGGLDYKKTALGQRAQQQANRSDVMERSVGIREKKFGLDVGGRNVPGFEMGPGNVLQPKEAAAGKTLRGNVQRALQSLDKLEKDFTQYGPDRLKSLGGVVPSEAITRMEGNRARALEAAMQLQGMNPTIGHQALLEAQLRDPASFKNINHAAYLDQIHDLKKAVHEAEQGFAAGHGVKTMSPLVNPEQPGESAETVDVISPEGKRGKIPAAKLNEAIKRGFKRG